MDFSPFWDPFWLPKSTKNWSKIDLQLKTKKSQNWWPLQHFSMIFAFQKLQNSLKNRPQNQSKKSSNSALIFDWFLTHFGSQNGSKNGPKSDQKSIKKSIKFSIDFLSIFGPFWPPTWWPQGVQRTTFLVSLLALEANLGQLGQLRPTWANLGQFCSQFGPTWAQLKANLGPTWSQFGPNLRLTWGQLGDNCVGLVG